MTLPAELDDVVRVNGAPCRVVVEPDLWSEVRCGGTRVGWVCQGCGSPFDTGQSVYGRPQSVTPDGTPVVGEFRCFLCWVSEDDK